MIDWNDIRYFLAVLRSGTTLGASRALGVSQSTVARRIAVLEEGLGLELFDKRQSGYGLTEAGAELLETAEAMETAAGAFITKAAARKRGLSGTVRLTTNDLFANEFLMRAMRGFRASFPEILLEVITSDRRLDLASGEADIALRASTPPTQPDLVGRRIAKDSWGVYCSRAYSLKNGMPTSIAELASHPAIGIYSEVFEGPVTAWARAHFPASAIVLRPNSVSALYAAIRNGYGIGLMSDVVGAGDPEMVRCFDPRIEHDYEIWLLTHERLRNVPRIRAVLDYLGGYFASGLHMKRSPENEFAATAP
ncbi:LysR family transcriptional regulator [Ensifer aridi]|uniref:LysR family transcriptional regulator n=1 Tax=Ensifer aridi TaxID=1708715 RepID=UPI00358E36F8